MPVFFDIRFLVVFRSIAFYLSSTLVSASLVVKFGDISSSDPPTFFIGYVSSLIRRKSIYVNFETFCK